MERVRQLVERSFLSWYRRQKAETSQREATAMERALIAAGIDLNVQGRLPKHAYKKNQALKKLRKNAKSAPQNLKLDCDLEFSIQKSIFENPKSISPIPLESCFEAQKFEISDVENP